MVLACAGIVVFSLMFTDVSLARIGYYCIASLFSLILVKLARVDSGVRVDYVQSGEAWAGILGACMVFFLVSENLYVIIISVWLSVVLYELYIHQLSRGRESDRLMVGYAFGALTVMAGLFLVINGLDLHIVSVILSGYFRSEYHAVWMMPVMALLFILFYAGERLFVNELLLYSQGEQYFLSCGYSYWKVKLVVMCIRSISAAAVISFSGVLAGVSAISIMLPERRGALQDIMTVLVVFSFVNTVLLVMTFADELPVIAGVLAVSYILHFAGGRRIVNG